MIRLSSEIRFWVRLGCLVGRVRTTLTTKQFNFKYSRGWGTEEEICNTDQANQDEKICLFSMSKRYAYDKNNNLETRRIAVL